LGPWAPEGPEGQAGQDQGDQTRRPKAGKHENRPKPTKPGQSLGPGRAKRAGGRAGRPRMGPTGRDLRKQNARQGNPHRSEPEPDGKTHKKTHFVSKSATNPEPPGGPKRGRNETGRKHRKTGRKRGPKPSRKQGRTRRVRAGFRPEGPEKGQNPRKGRERSKTARGAAEGVWGPGGTEPGRGPKTRVFGARRAGKPGQKAPKHRV